MNLEEFAIDPTLYEDGKRVDFDGGAYIRVRSAASERSQKVRERLWKPYANWTREIPPETVNRLNADWAAQGLLAEFVGFNVGGKPLDVDLGNPEDQRKLGTILAGPKYKAFLIKIRAIALDEAGYQAEEEGATEKNSDPTPDGASGGGAKRKT